MPTLLNIVELLGRISPFTALDERRCLSARDASGSCHQCSDNCPLHAISMTYHGPEIDSEICSGCGKCVSVCPTQSLSPLEPTDELVYARIEEVARNARAFSRPLVFACAKHDKKTPVLADSIVFVPCLAFLYYGHFIHSAASGCSQVVLISGKCENCELASAVIDLPQKISFAEALAHAWGRPLTINMVSTMPEEMCAKSSAEVEGALSRRDLFGHTRKRFLDSVQFALHSEAASREKQGPQSKADPSKRRNQLLDDLFGWGLPETVLPKEVCAQVEIENEQCSGCSLCAVFCPTKALVKAGKGQEGGALLEFSFATCISCGVCEQVCAQNALHLKPARESDRLFSLEPQEIEIPPRRAMPRQPSHG